MSTVSRRVRLSPEELFQLKWLLGGILALVGLGTLMPVDARSQPVLLVGFVLTAVLVALPGLSMRLPAGFWKALTPVLVGGFILDFVLSRPDFVGPLLRTVAVLGVVRAIAPRRRREDLQLVLLCLFMVIISGVLTLSLAFAVQILVFTPVAMFLLFLITLVEPRERAGEAPAAVALWRGFRWWAFVGRLRRALDIRLLGLAGLLFAAVVAMSSTIFIGMPRFSFEQGLPFLNLQNRTSMAGFSENIQLGEVVDIIENDAVALRVDVPGGVTPGMLPYWRMLVLDEYTGTGFRLSPSARLVRRHTTAIFPPNDAGRDAEENRWTFYLEPGVSRYLPSVGDYRRLRFQNQLDIEHLPHFGLINTPRMGNAVLFFQYEGVRPSGSVNASRVDASLRNAAPRPVKLPLVDARLPDRLRYPWTMLGVPAGEQNQAWLQSWVAEITGGGATTPEVFAERATAWLAARKRYALRASVPPGGGDLFLRWLASDAPGHCELFAGSFVLLARAAGHPARVVTGFKGGTWNGFENYYMVRNRDAHAWVEMLSGDGATWFRVDPTPGADAEAKAAEEDPLFGGRLLDRTFGAYLDSLRVLWYRRIVNFDEESQAELATKVREMGVGFWREWQEVLRARMVALSEWFRRPWSAEKVGGLMPWLAWLTAIVFLIRALPRAWNAWRQRGRGRSERPDPVRRQAGRWLERLRSAPQPPPAALVRELQALRYGAREHWPEPKPTWRRARRAWRECRHSQKAATGT